MLPAHPAGCCLKRCLAKRYTYTSVAAANAACSSCGARCTAAWESSPSHCATCNDIRSSKRAGCRGARGLPCGAQRLRYHWQLLAGVARGELHLKWHCEDEWVQVAADAGGPLPS